MSKRVVIGLWGNLGVGKDTVADVMCAEHGYRRYSFAAALKELARRLFQWSDEVFCGPSRMRNESRPEARHPYWWQSVYERASLWAPETAQLFARAPRLNLYRTMAEVNEAENALRVYNKDSVYERAQASCVHAQLLHVLYGLEDLGASLTPRVALQHLGTEFGRVLWQDVWLEAVRDKIDSDKAQRVVVTDVRFGNEAEFINSMGGTVWWVDASSRVPANDQFTHSSEATLVDAAPFIAGIINNNFGLDDLRDTVALVAANAHARAA